MRIVYLCRVFSGLETSLVSGIWRPTGAPTIYKVMERLAAGPHDVRFVLTTKGVGREFRTAWTARSDRLLALAGFRRPVTVLAGEHRFPAALGTLRGPLTTIRQLGHLAWLALRFRPELIYADRGNVLVAALFARLTGIPVVLRIMGVYPSMWQTLESTMLPDRLYRWAYRSPFALVVCTEDGTPGRSWLDQAMSPRVPRAMLLNGVAVARRPQDVDRRLAALPADRTVILFVGRFETYKGCDTFVAAISHLAVTHGDRIHALVIGTGSRHAAVTASVVAAGQTELFTFIDRLPHDQIGEAHLRSDIYVSMNQLGQLSNANLEAMLAGACLVMPPSRPRQDVDVATDRLVPVDAAVRLSPGDDTAETLSATLRRLVDDPGERRRLSAALAVAARDFVRTWDHRVDDEMALIGLTVGRSL